jgi:hypothetical protein
MDFANISFFTRLGLFLQRTARFVFAWIDRFFFAWIPDMDLPLEGSGADGLGSFNSLVDR